MSVLKWLIGDAVAVDELGNAVLLNGDAHETISAHCGAQYAVRRPCLFCRVVCGFIQHVLSIGWPNLRTHCLNAWEAEKQLVEDSKNLVGGGS